MATSQPLPIQVNRDIVYGTGYFQGARINRALGMRYPTASEFHKILLENPKRSSGVLPAWLGTNAILPPTDGRLPKRGDVVDRYDSRLVLPEQYLAWAKLAAEFEGKDYRAKNMAIVYHVSFFEEIGGRIFFHPDEILVQPALPQSGAGVMNAKSGMPEPTAENTASDQMRVWFARPNALLNRPLIAFFHHARADNRSYYSIELGPDLDASRCAVVGVPDPPKKPLLSDDDLHRIFQSSR